MALFDVNKSKTLANPVPRTSTGASPCAACSVRQLTICAALAADELSELSAIMSSVELGPGDPLFHEADEADYVFNVTAGMMKIYKLLPDGRRQVTGFLFPGDFLGLANQGEYAYSGEAVGPATLCRFPRRKLETLLERFPQLERRLLGMASNELAAAQEQMLLLGRKTAREKIASFLLMLSRRAQRRGQKGNPVNVLMSRTDIGDYLGLTTETVSRTFTQLKSAGTITLLAAGKVQVDSLESLEDLAEGM
jgi:CRP/FNR family transcriptional regulator